MTAKPGMRALLVEARLRSQRWQAWLLFAACYLFLLAIVTFGERLDARDGPIAGLASSLPIGGMQTSAMR